MKKLSAVEWLAIILIIIGGLNWGLVGLSNFDLVASIFGASVTSRIVYVVIGLAAVYVAVISVKLAKK